MFSFPNKFKTEYYFLKCSFKRSQSKTVSLVFAPGSGVVFSKLSNGVSKERLFMTPLITARFVIIRIQCFIQGRA